MKRGKKYKESAKLIDRTVQYDTDEAISSFCLSYLVALCKYKHFHSLTCSVWQDYCTTNLLVCMAAIYTKPNMCFNRLIEFCPNKTKVATIKKSEVEKIAALKMPDLNAASLEMSFVSKEVRSTKIGTTYCSASLLAGTHCCINFAPKGLLTPKSICADQEGMIIPVVITVYQDRSFSFITKTPPAAVLLKKASKMWCYRSKVNPSVIPCQMSFVSKEVRSTKIGTTYCGRYCHGNFRRMGKYAGRYSGNQPA